MYRDLIWYLISLITNLSLSHHGIGQRRDILWSVTREGGRMTLSICLSTEVVSFLFLIITHKLYKKQDYLKLISS